MTALLTTVIGLIGVYIAFALFASWANEQIATFLQLRSKTLIAGVRAMIGEAACADYFGHPLIVALGETRARNIWAWLGSACGLKYARESATTTNSSAPARQSVKIPPYVSSANFAVVLLDVLRKKAPGVSPLATFGAASTDVAAAINTISDPSSPYKPLYDVLLPIWRNAKGDYDQFAASLATWYDNEMERVSGWYKRSIAVILVYLGIAIALAFNLDTIQIVKELQRNSTLATSIANATQAFYTANEAAIKSSNGTLSIPSPSMTKACPSSGICTCDPGFVLDSAATPPVCRIDQSALNALPIGWSGTRWKELRASGAGGIWLKILGLAITTVAILLGAPFWFDVLGAIVNVRAAGAKPPPSSGS